MRSLAQEKEAPRQISSRPVAASGQSSSVPRGDMGSMVHLQRTMGNRAVQRLLAGRTRQPELLARQAALRSPETSRVSAGKGSLQRDGDDGSVGDATTDSSTLTSIASNDATQATSGGGQNSSDAGAGGCQVKIYSGMGCKPETQTNACPAGQCCAGPANHFAIGDAGAITSYKGSCAGPKLENRPSSPDVPCAWFYKDGGNEFLFSAMIDCPIPVS